MGSVQRKNLLPGAVLTLLFWFSLGGVIFGIDPEKYVVFLQIKVFYGRVLFGVFLFLGLFWTTALFLGHTRRGFEVALLTTSYVILKIIEKFNIWVFGTEIILVLALEIFLTLKKKKERKLRLRKGVIASDLRIQKIGD